MLWLAGSAVASSVAFSVRSILTMAGSMAPARHGACCCGHAMLRHPPWLCRRLCVHDAASNSNQDQPQVQI